MSAYKRPSFASVFAPASVRRKVEEEKKKTAIDFKSEAAFPSLGSKPEPETKKLVLNYGGAAAAGAKAPTPVTVPNPKPVVAAATVPKKKDIVTHCYDDIPDDYDGPDEDAEFVDVEAAEAEEEAAEFNAHIGTRRRGDNGIW
jgi:hypothetical protein